MMLGSRVDLKSNFPMSRPLITSTSAADVTATQLSSASTHRYSVFFEKLNILFSPPRLWPVSDQLHQTVSNLRLAPARGCVAPGAISLGIYGFRQTVPPVAEDRLAGTSFYGRDV